LANDPASRVDRQFIAKSGFQITHRNFPAGPIKNRGQRSENLTEIKTKFSRQKRNYLGRDEQTKPLKPVTKSFPTQTHRAL
jgi:hypothetical protein